MRSWSTEQALRYYQTTSMTDSERAKLIGGPEKWATAVERLTSLGFIEEQPTPPERSC
ncbi:MAG: hypothetical protein FWG56_04600 [Desulfovibrionaceae bacterium]|nr:hypothetical protein [Desulfovibrionaceae bacterium]